MDYLIERRIWHMLFSPPHRMSDLVNYQMVPVSGSQCGRCFDHDSTNLSTSAVILEVGRDSETDSKIKVEDHIPKLAKLYILLGRPAFKKKQTKKKLFTNTGGKTSENT